MTNLSGRLRIVVASLALVAVNFATASAQTPSPAFAKPWPYTDFGKPGAIASRRDVKGLGVTFVTFENGVRLIFKQTDAEPGAVWTSVRFGHGNLDRPVNRIDGSLLAARMMDRGGLNQLTEDERRPSMQAAGGCVSDFVGSLNTAFEISGVTRVHWDGGQPPCKQNLPLLFQLAAARLSDSAFHTDKWADELALRESSAGSLKAGRPDILHFGDMRWAVPSVDEMKSWKVEEAIDLIKPVAQTSPISVIVAGDASADAVILEVAKTLGALPKRTGAQPKPAGFSFPPPSKTPIRLPPLDKGDPATATVYWPTTDACADTKGYRSAVVMTTVLRNRIAERVIGFARYVRVNEAFDRELADYGYISASVGQSGATPEQAESLILRKAEELKTGDITPEELAKAKEFLRTARKQMEATGPLGWIGALADADIDPRRLDLIRNAESDTASVTVADVRASAKHWLDDAKSIRIYRLR